MGRNWAGSYGAGFGFGTRSTLAIPVVEGGWNSPAVRSA